MTGKESSNKRNMQKFVRYAEGAKMYSMGLSKFQELAKDAKACYKVGQLVLVNTEILDEYLETFRIVEDDFYVSRNQLYNRLREKEIYARKYFYPLTADQACFGSQYKNINLCSARKLAREILVLPFYEELEEEKIERIAEEIRRVR